MTSKTVPDAPPPERIYLPLPYAGVCSIVSRPDLPQQEYVRADITSRSEDSAWPLRDILNELIKWADHLRNSHDCDHHGYEVLLAAIDAAQPYLTLKQVAARSDDDYQQAYQIAEQTGLGIHFRSCTCGQQPCVRLAPIAKAIAAARVSAPAADEVEGAMVELREMSEVGAATLHIAVDRRTQYFRITIWPRDGEQSEFEVEGATLSEAMQAVHEWRDKEKS